MHPAIENSLRLFSKRLKRMELQEKVLSCLWMLFATRITAISATLEDVERHLELGKQFLSRGQFADALTHYHAAVDIDPNNYQTFYRRATVYLAMGKSKAALPDLDRVVQLKPDFVSARMQRGSVLLKQGDLDNARKDFQAVLDTDPQNSDGQNKLAEIAPLEEQIRLGKDMYNQGDTHSALHYLSAALDVSSWNAELRLLRADCHKRLGDLGQATADVRAATKLLADSADAYLTLSLMILEMGDVEESLSQIRECLKLDPDHKECFAHYKKVKKLDKQIKSMQEASAQEEWGDCIERWQAALKTEPRQPRLRHELDKTACRCQVNAGHSAEALAICSAVLELEPDNTATLCDRAEAHLLEEDYESALRDFESALQTDEGNRRAREGVSRVQKLKKQAGRRDYYKILGLKRNAKKTEITKAYRKLAQQWHPDNFSDDDEKKKAEAKFIDIAAAKEVLSDPEKRKKFDNGEDPLDAEQQAQQGHPFQQGGFHFNPFGGGPFSFKFHYG